MNPDGSDQRPVVNDAGYVEPGQGGYGTATPKLSPDGRKVLLPRNGIAFASLATGATHQITTSKAGDEGSAVWSPDGRAIAYTDSNVTGTFVTDLRSGVTREIVSKSSEPVSWSPDGKWMLINREIGDFKAQLWLARSDGSGFRQVTDYVPLGGVSWRSDTRVEFAGVPNEDGNAPARLILIDLRTDKLTELAKLGYASAVAWSPDGRRLAYTANDVYTMNTDGTGRHPLGLPNLDPIDNQQLAWSPDGQNLVAVRYDNFYKGGGPIDELWSVSADGSHRRQLTRVYPDGLQNVAPLWTMSHVHAVAPPSALQSGRVLHVPWDVAGVTASGARAVVVPHTADSGQASPLLVWQPGSKTLSLMGSFCADMQQAALSASRLAVTCTTATDPYGETQALFVFDLKTRAPSQVASDGGSGGIDGPDVVGGQIEYETSAWSGSTPELFRVVGSSKRPIASLDGTLIAAASTRLVIQLTSGRLELATADGHFIRDFDQSVRPPIVLAGTTLYELSHRHLKAWNTETGLLRWAREVPAHAKLQSGDTGVAVYAAGQDVYIASATKLQAIHTPGLVARDAALTPAGLFYAYNVHAGGHTRGRVVFMPRSALLR